MYSKTSAIIIQRVLIFHDNEKILLEGTQTLSRVNNITVTTSVSLVRSKPNDKDCIAFTHLESKEECLNEYSELN